MPESELPSDPASRAAILKDFEDPWGDRRQELVFIGQKMRDGGQDRIRKVLDACLLNDAEFDDWETAMRSDNCEDRLVDFFEDGFEEWADPHEGHDHEHGHH
jgi:ribosomal 50S subunit-associated protein YjgA (DUF615 family)